MKRPLIFSVLLVLGVLAGCASPMGGGSATKTYQLSLSEPLGLQPRTSTGAVLLVTRPQADPGYETRGIVYSTAPHELAYYSQSQWADTPARMLEPAIGKAIEESGLFEAVVRPPMSAPADYQLITDISQLRHQLADGRGRVELELRAQLLSLAPRSVLATRTITASAPAPTEDAPGAVAGAHAALREALTELTSFIEAAIQEQEAQ